MYSEKYNIAYNQKVNQLISIIDYSIEHIVSYNLEKSKTAYLRNYLSTFLLYSCTSVFEN